MPERISPLFIGDHLALDFLNTVATPKGVPVEWLENGQDLIDWLRQANLIPEEISARYQQSKDLPTLDVIAGRARVFRAWLREFVTMRMGKPLTEQSATTLQPLNELLAKDTSYATIESTTVETGLRLRRVRRWESPEELLQPIADVAADLICTVDFRMIRACEGQVCSLLFLDRTKAHGRRWCSMSVCGNRAKANAFRNRQKSD